MTSTTASLPYHEPGIVTILVLASFLLLENAVNYVLDGLIYCGLIGQIAVGVAWGTPGANWLSLDVQNTVQQLGYLGLILLVYEGGLQTNIKTLKSNLVLSATVAIIGISAPIALSFTLQGFVNDVTPVQGFAAGAALCSTSLGTTFTILSTSGLSQSRLGVVLSSAAMMDDIVGLVMSGIISSLGQSSDFSATTVLRPVFVSIAFAVLLPLICAWAVKPLTKICYRHIETASSSRLSQQLRSQNAALIGHTLVISALVAASSYAGTSNLFAAYLAGASITWWNAVYADLRHEARSTEHQQEQERLPTEIEAEGSQNAGPSEPTASRRQSGSETRQHSAAVPKADRVRDAAKHESAKSIARNSNYAAEQVHSREDITGSAIFEKHFHPALEAILKPFFFASIGFSIPISRMFTGSVVWRGIVYSILMVIAKLFCGLCLIRFAGPSIHLRHFRKLMPSSVSSCLPWPIRTKAARGQQADVDSTQQARISDSASNSDATQPGRATDSGPARPKRSKVPKPVSLYPAALLGSAMVARGEIGFLISSVAESDGVFGPAIDGGSSELFLIVTWAILLCTILGPLTVGLMVKRVKRLQEQERSRKTGRPDPLGIWGIVG